MYTFISICYQLKKKIIEIFQEEDFEWGNPRAKDLPKIEGNDLSVASAAFRLRKKFQSVVMPSSKGIFKDFRVILKTSKNDSLRTLIEAGRGTIVEVDAK